MDFSLLGFEILKYWDILVQYINPLAILFWAIIGGLIGLILAIILLIVFRKQIFIKRHHWTLKWLSYTYIVFLPLFTGFSFAQWSAIYNCEVQIVRNIPKYLGDTNKLYNTFLKAEIQKIVCEEVLGSSSNDLLDDALKTAQYYINNVISDQNKNVPEAGSGKNKMAFRAVNAFVGSHYVRELIISEIRNKAGNLMLLDEELTKDLFDTEIQKLLDSGLINTILEKHIKHLMGGFKLNILLRLSRS